MQTKRTKKAGIVGKYGMLHISWLQVPDMVPVCASKLRKWKFRSMQSISVNSVERYNFFKLCVCCEKKSSWDLGMQGLREGEGRWCLYLEVSVAVTVRSTIRRLREQTES
ncbi:hypothetical protein BHM03_00056172 [Ensete ventricosum]|nr:hypothetical protein BHM03_00056172 [Ensete ventricosum]